MRVYLLVISCLVMMGCSLSEERKKLNSADYHTYFALNSLSKFDSVRKGRIAFLGGSITYNPGWRDSVSNHFELLFPTCEFEFINAGIPSMGSTPGAFRLERDVLSRGPIDLIFVEAAVNDATNERSQEEQLLAMEGIVRHLKRTNAAMDVIFMYFVDPDKIKDYQEGQTPEVIGNHSSVAAHYHLPELNLAKEVSDRIENGEFTWEGDFKNLHPSPFGQGIYARSMIQFIDNSVSISKKTEKSSFSLPKELKINCFDNGKLVEAANSESISGWIRNLSWTPEDGLGTRENYVAVPMLIGDNSTDTLNFTFTGNTVGIAVAAGKDAAVIHYSIDSQSFRELSLKTKWSNGLHLPWYYTLRQGMEDSSHLLKIVVAPNSGVCRIRYFFVNQPTNQ